MTCFVYKDIRDLQSIDHLCIDPILWIGSIHACSIDSRYLKWSVKLVVYLTIVDKLTPLSLSVGTTVNRVFVPKRVGDLYYDLKYK